jgi:hypothetical protein
VELFQLDQLIWNEEVELMEYFVKLDELLSQLVYYILLVVVLLLVDVVVVHRDFGILLH